MKFRNLAIILIILMGTAGLIWYRSARNSPNPPTISAIKQSIQEQIPIFTHPLMISEMRRKDYPGSEIVIEQTLPRGSNYNRYIASYKSEGLKINGLLTIPDGPKPDKGYPAIVFNHGYIPPKEYKTTERYVAYQDGFARNGYITYKIDYRGNADSEGTPSNAQGSPDYTTDVLNAAASLQKYPRVNPEKIGAWGHSMGGGLTQRAMVVSNKIKVGVIWAGVVGSYEDLLTYRRRTPWLGGNSASPSSESLLRIQEAINQNIVKEVDPTFYLDDISGPIQLHHGTSDESVPIELSQSLYNKMKEKGKVVELYTYEGADHNLSGAAFGPAMQRSIEFFDKYLK